MASCSLVKVLRATAWEHKGGEQGTWSLFHHPNGFGTCFFVDPSLGEEGAKLLQAVFPLGFNGKGDVSCTGLLASFCLKVMTLHWPPTFSRLTAPESSAQVCRVPGCSERGVVHSAPNRFAELLHFLIQEDTDGLAKSCKALLAPSCGGSGLQKTILLCF